MSEKQESLLSENLLIIGAGAHKPYDMPTSKELTNIIKGIYSVKISFTKELVVKNTSQAYKDKMAYKDYKRHICNLIKTLGIIERPVWHTIFNPEAKRLSRLPSELHYMEHSDEEWDALVISEYDKFLESFCGSQVYSIDRYLAKLSAEPDKERQELWTAFGKLTIACIIHNCETNDLFGTKKDDWFELIIDRHIAPNLNKFLNNPPRIITFNYDRLLEKSIYSHLVYYHKYTEEAAASAVRALPITHVYGVLNDFICWETKEENTQEKNLNLFGYEDDTVDKNYISEAEFYKTAISNIKVIGEERDADKLSETKEKIQSYFNDAKKIYFIGYGFDSLNNQFLFKDMSSDWTDYKDIYLTQIQIDKSKIKQVVKQLPFIRFQYDANRHPLQIDCFHLLSEYAPLEKPWKMPQQIERRPATLGRRGGFATDW